MKERDGGLWNQVVQVFNHGQIMDRYRWREFVALCLRSFSFYAEVLSGDWPAGAAFFASILQGKKPCWQQDQDFLKF